MGSSDTQKDAGVGFPAEVCITFSLWPLAMKRAFMSCSVVWLPVDNDEFSRTCSDRALVNEEW